MSEASSEDEGGATSKGRSFPSTMPDLGFAGIHVVRSMVQPDSEDETDDLKWSIWGTVAHQPTWTVLMGEFFLDQKGFDVAVTVSGLVHYRDGAFPFDPDDDEAAGQHVTDLAHWASDVMYDVAAGTARQLIGSIFPGEDLVVPLGTPDLRGVEYRSDVE